MFPWRMPDTWGVSSSLILYSESLVQDARPKLLALAIASLLLLVIACGNVANLLLTRWILRGREFAVREAVGAGRGRILRQVVTENIILAGAGATAGVAAALALVKVLPVLLGEIPRLSEIAIVPSAGVLAGIIMLTTFAILSVAPAEDRPRSGRLR
jgi:ABC-type antimicrobial peptide transport system permease subunit